MIARGGERNGYRRSQESREFEGGNSGARSGTGTVQGFTLRRRTQRRL